MRGRKRKPTEIKKAEGNPGKRPLNESEPKPPNPTSLDPPDWLNEIAKREWWALAPELERMGLLTLVDRAAMAMYCHHYSIVQMCRAQMGEGMTVAQQLLHETPNGHMQASPYNSMLNQASMLMHKYQTEFGLTPASRARVSTDPEGKADPDEEMFG